MPTLRGEQRLDYFNVLCECGGPTKNEYLGFDPAVPHFKAECPRCGATYTLKLDAWRGLPSRPARRPKRTQSRRRL
jgi:hypothetical protein